MEVTRKLLNILIQLAEADKHFAKAEREMVFRVAQERGFAEDVVSSLIKNPEPIENLSTLTQEQKFEYLYSCIDMIFADHNIFESEIIFAKNIAIKLGFRKDAIDHFVKNHGKFSRDEFRKIALRDFT
jgi:uncharacterized tellurite resistance protein B-like protein